MDTALILPDGSPLLRGGFVTLTFALLALFVLAVYHSARGAGADGRTSRRQALVAAVAAAAWLGFAALLAARGVLQMWGPPTMGLVLAPSLVLPIALAASPLGARFVRTIPIAWLVGFQGFRVLVELLLHRAYVEGLMPVQMSYTGRNFDIVSGITALLLGAWLATGRRSTALVTLWNLLGIALLANIVILALLSAPTPFRAFTSEPPNVWITRAPWVWLPAAMVFAAVLGHALVTRWIIAARRGGSGEGHW